MAGYIYRQPPSPFIGGRQPLAPYQQTPPDGPEPLGQPAISHPGRNALWQILSAWIPGPPLPTRGYRKIVVSVDDPPFSHPSLNPRSRVVSLWQPSVEPQRQQAIRRLIVSVDDPPFTLRTGLWSVLRAWQPQPRAPQRAPLLVPSVADVVNDPPFGLRTPLWPITTAWRKPPDVIRRQQMIVQEGPAPPVGATWPGWYGSKGGWF